MDFKYPEIGYKVELPYMSIEVIAEDIVRFATKHDLLINMEKAMEMYHICKELFPNRGYKSLKIVEHKMKLEQNVMNFLASDERKHLISVEAVVVNSAALKFLGNFYLKIKRPVIPTKIFDNEKQAVEWLTNIKTQAIDLTKLLL